MIVPSAVRRLASRVLPQPRSLHCVACGRPRSATRLLVSGPAFYVCEQCISAELARVESDTAFTGCHRCDWCRAPRLPSDVRSLGPTTICLSCLGYVRSVFAGASRIVT
jgi:hypothetical protein